MYKITVLIAIGICGRLVQADWPYPECSECDHCLPPVKTKAEAVAICADVPDPMYSGDVGTVFQIDEDPPYYICWSKSCDYRGWIDQPKQPCPCEQCLPAAPDQDAADAACEAIGSIMTTFANGGGWHMYNCLDCYQGESCPDQDTGCSGPVGKSDGPPPASPAETCPEKPKQLQDATTAAVISAQPACIKAANAANKAATKAAECMSIADMCSCVGEYVEAAAGIECGISALEGLNLARDSAFNAPAASRRHVLAMPPDELLPVDPSQRLGCFIDNEPPSSYSIEDNLNSRWGDVQIYGMEVKDVTSFYQAQWGTALATQGSPKMTLELCQGLCAGYDLFGAGAGYVCECRNGDADAYGTAQESDCDKPCNGDATQSCGGSFRLDVYTVGLNSDPPSPPTPAGGDSPSDDLCDIIPDISACYDELPAPVQDELNDAGFKPDTSAASTLTMTAAALAAALAVVFR